MLELEPEDVGAAAARAHRRVEASPWTRGTLKLPVSEPRVRAHDDQASKFNLRMRRGAPIVTVDRPEQARSGDRPRSTPVRDPRRTRSVLEPRVATVRSRRGGAPDPEVPPSRARRARSGSFHIRVGLLLHARSVASERLPPSRSAGRRRSRPLGLGLGRRRSGLRFLLRRSGNQSRVQPEAGRGQISRSQVARAPPSRGQARRPAGSASPSRALRRSVFRPAQVALDAVSATGAPDRLVQVGAFLAGDGGLLSLAKPLARLEQRPYLGRIFADELVERARRDRGLGQRRPSPPVRARHASGPLRGRYAPP